MKMNLKKGFTLIELLVVVAIIGILASVVLASLNSARSKGKDSAASSQIASLQALSVIYADNNNGSYAGFCSDVSISGTRAVLLAALQATLSGGTLATPGTTVSGGVTLDYTTATTSSTTNYVKCYSSPSEWAAGVQLTSTTGRYYCSGYVSNSPKIQTKTGTLNTSTINTPTLLCS